VSLVQSEFTLLQTPLPRPAGSYPPHENVLGAARYTQEWTGYPPQQRAWDSQQYDTQPPHWIVTNGGCKPTQRDCHWNTRTDSHCYTGTPPANNGRFARQSRNQRDGPNECTPVIEWRLRWDSSLTRDPVGNPLPPVPHPHPCRWYSPPVDHPWSSLQCIGLGEGESTKAARETFQNVLRKEQNPLVSSRNAKVMSDTIVSPDPVPYDMTYSPHKGNGLTKSNKSKTET
jgi:hypothetical protein